MQTTLEERVNRLIERSNQTHQSNLGLNRDNRDNSHNSRRPPFQQNQRSRGDFQNNPHQPPSDIRQSLREPKPNATGPFGESDGSRPIQCFKCRGWDHPKHQCPSQLNYTRGSGTGTPLPNNGQMTQGSSFQQLVSSTIDMQISQVVQRYNLDPFLG